MKEGREGVATYLLRKIGQSIMVFVILLLLAIGIIRIFFPYIDQYKALFEQKASAELQQPVEIGAVDANWRGLLPVINLNNIAIYDKQRQAKLVQIQQVQLIPRIWSSLYHRQISFSHLSLIATQLSIKQLRDNTWDINGIIRQFSNEQTNNSGITKALNWLYAQGKVVITNVNIDWQGLDGVVLSANNAQMKLNPDDTQHVMHFSATNINLKMEKLFTTPLKFDQLTVGFDYSAFQKNSQLYLKDLVLINKDVQINGRVKINKIDGNSDKFVQLIANVSGHNIALMNNYIPKGLLKKGLVDWLKTAFLKSDGYHGQVILQGPIRQFPYKNHTGRFEALITVENLDLYYKEGWPKITNMSGNLLFDNASLQFEITKAFMLGMPTGIINGNIPNLKNAVLNIRWSSLESYRNLSKVIFNSPLQKMLGKTLSYIDYIGPSKLGINISIPIRKNNGKDIKLAGKFELLPKGILKVPAYNITIARLQGILQFTEDSLSGENIKGIWLGQPIKLDISTKRNAPLPTEISINAIGVVDFSALGQNYNLAFIPKIINGKSPYNAELKFFTGKDQPNNILVINSNLSGASIQLPEPFKKTFNESLPSKIQIETVKSSRLFTLNYGKKLSGIISLRESNKNKWQLDSANIQIGNANAQLPKVPSIIVEGSLPQFNVTEVAELFSTNQQSVDYFEKFTDFMNFIGQNPKRVNLYFDQLNIMDMTIHKATIQATGIAKLLKIKIASQEIAGNLIIPHNLTMQPIQAVFQRFYLTSAITSAISSKTKNFKDKSINPGSIPSLYLFFEDFYYNNHSLGEICLITLREKNAMIIKEFTVDFPYFSLFSSGIWQDNGGNPHTFISGKIKTTSLGDFLKNWYITQSVGGGKGAAKFAIEWDGPAYNPKIDTLRGDANLEFKDGEILKVVNKPSDSGIGLILNLLTFEILKQIFTPSAREHSQKSDLDFSILSASLTMKNGNAYTDNILLDGEMAKVKSTGRIGLASQDYNLLVYVTPYVANAIVPGSGLPVIGKMIRASLMVVNKTIGSVLDGFFKMTYHVTGPWSSPSFDKINS